ncbi:MAG TPA: hypothetical protein VII82_14215 [Polyangiaceae bacterium]
MKPAEPDDPVFEALRADLVAHLRAALALLDAEAATAAATPAPEGPAVRDPKDG